ncbi:MAG: 30S ribosomal protein S4 [Planctomycetes bacterium]|nr:30S ribosomal protein S4 [Planctomycetota bacterium]
MSKTLGPKCRLCRRETIKLFLKGQRCFTQKCSIEKNRGAPGQHGKKRLKVTDYGIHHREAMKLKKHYGIFTNQLQRIMDIAVNIRGNSGENLLKLLERRIDNVLYRAGFCLSRSQARQVVTHNHVKVNSKSVRTPSYVVDPGDTVEFRTDSGKKIAKEAFAVRNKQQDRVATWIKVVDVENPKCTIIQEPDLKETQIEINPLLIVEFLTK